MNLNSQGVTRASIKPVIAASAERMEMVFRFLEIYSHSSLIFLKKPVHCQHLAIQNSKQQYRRLTLPSMIKEI